MIDFAALNKRGLERLRQEKECVAQTLSDNSRQREGAIDEELPEPSLVETSYERRPRLRVGAHGEVTTEAARS